MSCDTRDAGPACSAHQRSDASGRARDRRRRRLGREPVQGDRRGAAAARPGDIMPLNGGILRRAHPLRQAGHARQLSGVDARRAVRGGHDGIDFAAGHIWLEGITVRNQACSRPSPSLPRTLWSSAGAGSTTTTTRCTPQQGGTNWYIADNTIVDDPASRLICVRREFDPVEARRCSNDGHELASERQEVFLYG